MHAFTYVHYYHIIVRLTYIIKSALMLIEKPHSKDVETHWSE